jgi:hypothetical protein
MSCIQVRAWYKHLQCKLHMKNELKHRRAPVGSPEITIKAARLQGDSEEFVPSHCVVALGPVVSRARVLIHEVTRADKLAEQ